jgi:hypothetical protein
MYKIPVTTCQRTQFLPCSNTGLLTPFKPVWLYPFMTTALEGGEGSASPWPLFIPGKEPVPIIQEAVWALGPVWTGAENLAPPPEFDSRTVQPIASRYTDYATLSTARTITNIWMKTTNLSLTTNVKAVTSGLKWLYHSVQTKESLF